MMNWQTSFSFTATSSPNMDRQHYENMGEKPDQKSFDMKQAAHKIKMDTKRALNYPLQHLVAHPKDEQLIREDSNTSTNNVSDNGAFNEIYGNYPKEQDNGKRRKMHSASETNLSTMDMHRNNLEQIPISKYNTSQKPVQKINPYSTNYGHSCQEEYSRFTTFPLRTDPSGDGTTRFRSTDSLSRVDNRPMPKKGDCLSFHNIAYKIKTKKYLWSKPETKVILNNVSGIMLPGVNAIMGPTGSGKSSILDVLAGRKDPQFLEGKVLVNGMPQPKNFKCMTGYVVQDDIVMGTLTVKENLMFSAALRLSRGVNKQERENMVMKVIEELDLTAVTDSKIGTELIRGVSGGERKRTNIGMELITDPKVLFLDEPTTGLDAFTAGSVIKTLQKLSRKGKTIILSIHQPKYSIYKLFDRYTLMAKGKIIYHGKGGSAPINYFYNLGYVIEAHNNPADFYMDIINGEVKNSKEILDHSNDESREESLLDLSIEQLECCQPRKKSIKNIILKKDGLYRMLIGRWKTLESGLESSGEFANIKHIGRSKSDAKGRKKMIDKLVDDWQESHCNKELRNQLQMYDMIPEDDVSFVVKANDTVNYATSWINQLNWVCWRTALNLLRNPQTSTIQLGVYLFFAVSMGVVYFGLKTTINVSEQDRYGLFFFSALQVMFVNLGAIEIFIKERPIFIHENSSGYYRVSSYFFAKLLCDMVPIKVFPAVVFLPITYFMAKLKYDAGAFFFFELILLLTTAAGCSIAFFVSATCSVFGLANVITPIIYVFMMVFSGYLITIDSIFPWLNWCRWISAFRYALCGLSVNELSGLTFCQDNNTTPCEFGEEFLRRNAIPYGSAWSLWQNPLGLTIICLVFLILCYIQLRRINKYK